MQAGRIRSWHLLVTDEGHLRVEESLRLSADRVGLSFHTVRKQRWVAAQWPEEYCQEGVSYEVQRILGSSPARFALIKDPPLNKRTGLRQWTGDLAKKAVGWKTDTPATAQEKVVAIHELVRRHLPPGHGQAPRPGAVANVPHPRSPADAADRSRTEM
ncbi:DUF6192 family protein [Streptomyces sp. E11-3]|uniref:DUF6192 family protein n=1 Tax=Streptomyces sp. E11-3 TaxID=3110112 RepID=UPI0039816024